MATDTPAEDRNPSDSSAAPPAAGPQPAGRLRDVPYMGVIWVVDEAVKLGFENGHPDWCNLGQGQPEVGELPGAPPRISTLALRPEDHAYGPLGGTLELRTAIAEHYNRLYRRGAATQYGPRNVAVAQGGRLALSRAMAALAAGSVGYQVPDYTAYQDMFELHLSRLVPRLLPTREADGHRFDLALFEREARAGLSALLLSNPCNPTGQVLRGEELQRLLSIGRRHGTLLLLDEFYSHFIFDRGDDGRWGPGAGPVSAAAHVGDIEQDPVLIFDGLTKNHRYPGWRVGWVVGPEALVETIARVASSLDGGPSRLAQRAALEALQPETADRETAAVRAAFAIKRNLMVAALRRMGVHLPVEPQSTFYAWGRLPAQFPEALEFFRRALARRVLTVPGAFFDVNPGALRPGPSPFGNWMRFSFGPPEANLRLGLSRLEAMVAESR